MSLIYFYDATDLDREQLSAGLASTDHAWEYIAEHVSVHNLHPDTEVLSVHVGSVVSAEIIQSLPNLKLICCRSTGFNNIDLAAAHGQGIVVVSVPGYGEQTVAEFAFALILSLSRKVALEIRDTKLQESPSAGTIGFDLLGKTIGVVGTGRIGKKTIAIAQGFGMKVLAYDVFVDAEFAAQHGVEYMALDDLLAHSDVVSLHAPYTPENHHLINAERLALMKPTAILINTARGELIDTKALAHALYDKKLGGAGLDVVEGEKYMSLDEDLSLSPVSGSSTEQALYVMALQKMSNVVLTPHIAFNTIEAIGRINTTTVENIIKYWIGEPQNVVETKPKSGVLYVVRHTRSEWNELGKWTGSRDMHLSEHGFRDAAEIGLYFKDKKIDEAFCSQQIRTLETMEAIFDTSGQLDVPFERSALINERDYGDYTGMIKWDVQTKIGEQEFEHVRRDWDYPVPNGETLKTVYERALPYFLETILPKICGGKNVLLVAHGNSIRSLMKYIENISDQDMTNVEMPFGSVLTYQLDDEGRMTSKHLEQIINDKPNA